MEDTNCTVIVWLLYGYCAVRVGKGKGENGKLKTENGKQIIQKHNKDAKDCVLVDILAFSLELIIF